MTVLDTLERVALSDLVEEEFGIDGDLEVAESVQVVGVESFSLTRPF